MKEDKTQETQGTQSKKEDQGHKSELTFDCQGTGPDTFVRDGELLHIPKK